jgi:hypothetical protein
MARWMQVMVLDTKGNVYWLSTSWGKHALDELRRHGMIILFSEIHE